MFSSAAASVACPPPLPLHAARVPSAPAPPGCGSGARALWNFHLTLGALSGLFLRLLSCHYAQAASKLPAGPGPAQPQASCSAAHTSRAGLAPGTLHSSLCPGLFPRPSLLLLFPSASLWAASDSSKTPPGNMLVASKHANMLLRRSGPASVSFAFQSEEEEAGHVPWSPSPDTLWKGTRSHSHCRGLGQTKPGRIVLREPSQEKATRRPSDTPQTFFVCLIIGKVCVRNSCFCLSDSHSLPCQEQKGRHGHRHLQALRSGSAQGGLRATNPGWAGLGAMPGPRPWSQWSDALHPRHREEYRQGCPLQRRTVCGGGSVRGRIEGCPSPQWPDPQLFSPLPSPPLSQRGAEENVPVLGSLPPAASSMMPPCLPERSGIPGALAPGAAEVVGALTYRLCVSSLRPAPHMNSTPSDSSQ